MTDEDEIRDLYKQYLAAQRKGDADEVASLYVDDALLMPPGKIPISGRADIRRYYEGAMSSSVKLSLNQIKVDDDSCYLAYMAQWEGDTGPLYAAVLDVLRRENGKWQLAACMWNSSDGFPVENPSELPI